MIREEYDGKTTFMFGQYHTITGLVEFEPDTGAIEGILPLVLPSGNLPLGVELVDGENHRGKWLHRRVVCGRSFAHTTTKAKAVLNAFAR